MPPSPSFASSVYFPSLRPTSSLIGSSFSTARIEDGRHPCTPATIYYINVVAHTSFHLGALQKVRFRKLVACCVSPCFRCYVSSYFRPYTIRLSNLKTTSPLAKV